MYTLIKFAYYLVLEKELECCCSPVVPALGRDALWRTGQKLNRKMALVRSAASWVLTSQAEGQGCSRTGHQEWSRRQLARPFGGGWSRGGEEVTDPGLRGDELAPRLLVLDSWRRTDRT